MTGELPMRVPDPGLPARVRVHEVGPRDGLQNEKTIVPVAVKAEFIHRLADAGLTTVEATSFVHPAWVPQLADAAELMPLLEDLGDRAVRLPVLVPNERGLDRALSLGVREIAVFASATETLSLPPWSQAQRTMASARDNGSVPAVALSWAIRACSSVASEA